jgi:hypothetical protein
MIVDAITIMMPALVLIAEMVGAILTVLVFAAVAGKFFGSFIK